MSETETAPEAGPSPLAALIHGIATLRMVEKAEHLTAEATHGLRNVALRVAASVGVHLPTAEHEHAWLQAEVRRAIDLLEADGRKVEAMGLHSLMNAAYPDAHV